MKIILRALHAVPSWKASNNPAAKTKTKTPDPGFPVTYKIGENLLSKKTAHAGEINGEKRELSARASFFFVDGESVIGLGKILLVFYFLFFPY